MFCCISKHVPHEPVVSRVSGCLYERSLIEKYIAEHGRCPITGEPLHVEDLIAVRPTALTGSSPSSDTIPSMLAKLHSQWDAVMLEQFALRQQLAQTQQELAQALHQYEAACRVIATLIKDRETSGKNTGEEAEENESHDGEGISLPEAVQQDLSEYDTSQRAKRKARVSPSSLASEQNIRDFVEDSSINVENCPWAVAFATGNSVFVGLDDTKIAQYDFVTGRLLRTGLGHERRVRHILSCSNSSIIRVISASDDTTLRVWGDEGESLICQGVIRHHKGEIVGIGGTIAGHLLLSASTESIGLSDIDRLDSIISTPAMSEGVSSFTCLSVHPYGSLAALGIKGDGLCIWNTRQMCVDTTVSLPCEGEVCSLDFSADCFTLATGISNGKTFLWDLRKMSGPLYEIPPMVEAITLGGGKGVENICSEENIVVFDNYGKYLAVAGNGIRIFDWSASSQQPLSVLGSHLQPITGICWGEHARNLISCSMDSTVKLYGSA